MKRALITLGIATFLLGLMIYIAFNFSPYDSEKLAEVASIIGVSDTSGLTDNIGDMIGYGLVFSILDMESFWIMILLEFGLIVTVVGGLHMLIDKLFFKKFYEEPRIWPAIRRGVIVALVIFGILFFRLIGGLMWQNVGLILVLGIVLELLLIKFTDNNN